MEWFVAAVVLVVAVVLLAVLSSRALGIKGAKIRRLAREVSLLSTAVGLAHDSVAEADKAVTTSENASRVSRVERDEARRLAEELELQRDEQAALVVSERKHSTAQMAELEEALKDLAGLRAGLDQEKTKWVATTEGRLAVASAAAAIEMATALAVVESELERVKGDYDGLIKTHNTLMNYGGTVLWEGEVDTEDAAKILGVSHTTVRSWRVQGKILSRETVAILSRPANAYDRAALEDLAKKRAKKRAMRQARPSARASLSSTSTP
jgi:hypothetical protein